jgi:hypothetical protein
VCGRGAVEATRGDACGSWHLERSDGLCQQKGQVWVKLQGRLGEGL